ncbi:CRISPR-associated endonuclease Cas2 [Marinobacterium aestuarii]|uniref:CRISPR-associated endoribonuclease Cas2 n=1 Tax=Marinobacterium aestuarii TaxID=1821621 RepID=A0A1A9EVN1_9GAMM|nr:CRISPR-associated endonuclease Cas2 [Marinobacterium aestuarii]ANG62224.1 CRISPR-associated endonuclease Cas2 [Marinobacterium aestuarii]
MTSHWYLLAYDIRSPRRLQRLQRFLRTQAYVLQESVFAWQGDDEALAILQVQLLKLIRPGEDDLRGYRIPANTLIHFWGASPFLEGVFDNGYPAHQLHDFKQSSSVTHPDIMAADTHA